MKLEKKLFLLISINIIIISSFLTAQGIEMPASSGPVYSYTGYTLQYNERYEIADWTAYELTAPEVFGRVKRSNNFREDPLILTGSSQLSDYHRSGYDRGHLVPAGDMKWSSSAMSDSFFLSNITPQSKYFNREIWRDLEELVRKWAIHYKGLLIATGPVVAAEGYKTIGENKVAVPEYFFKVIIDYRKPDLKGIGFLIPNKKCRKSLRDYSLSIDEVENKTGIDFFYQIPDRDEEMLEADSSAEKWFWD